MSNNDGQLKELVVDYYEKQGKFNTIKNKFESMKKMFYSEMDKYFKGKNDDTLYIDLCNNNELIKVKKIQSVNIKFDADMLEKKLPKEICNVIINKHYEVNNMEGLIKYLKKCGVNPKIFKQFLTVTKSVDTKMLEQYEAIGKISNEQIKDCYSVSIKEPYYKVSGGKGGNQ